MNNDENKSPLFKTWRQWYVFVIVFLILMIVLLSLFTKAFS